MSAAPQSMRDEFEAWICKDAPDKNRRDFVALLRMDRQGEKYGEHWNLNILWDTWQAATEKERDACAGACRQQAERFAHQRDQERCDAAHVCQKAIRGRNKATDL